MKALVAALALALSILPATPGAGSYWCPLEDVIIVTHDGTIELYHVQAEYNCCAWVDFDVIVEGSAIDIYEWECFEGDPCTCMCCFELKVAIGGLDPGIYTVTLWKHGVFFGVWYVAVDGTSPESLETQYFPCVETGASPFWADSWGTIKALYR
jgi:hypothetical protein